MSLTDCYLLRNNSKYSTVRYVSVSGTLRLASNDPLAKPVIQGNYLTDPLDVAILVEGIRIALSFGNTTAMGKYNMTLSNVPLAACSQYPFLSNDYWGCAVRQETGPENHQAGSCKMGPSSDRMAVVDPQLKVHGIRGLRVADTSVMPQVRRGYAAKDILFFLMDHFVIQMVNHERT